MLIAAGIVIFMLMGIFAPYETLGWWAGWYDDALDKESLAEPVVAQPSDASSFIIYLTGVGATSPHEYSYREQLFLKGLREQMPHVCVIDKVFPYSNTNRALTGDRVFSGLWRLLRRYKKRRSVLKMMGNLINMRNFWQVLMSADSRYGPLYNYASSQLMLYHLLKNGYVMGSGVSITIIGYSGAGQIAIGAAPLLKRALDAPLHVISLAGIISSDKGLLELDSITHLYGNKDRSHQLSDIIFPYRWSWYANSTWNEARRRGIYKQYCIGPMVHTGKNGYLDHKTAFPNGQTYLEKTLEVVESLIGSD